MSGTPSLTPGGADVPTAENITSAEIQRIIEILLDAVSGDRFRLRQLLYASNDAGQNLLEVAVKEALEKLDPTIETYSVPIEGILQTLNDEAFRLELGGNYDRVNHQIIRAAFFSINDGYDPNAPYRGEIIATNKEVKTVHYNRVMTTRQVLDDLDARGLRPATLEELHALGKAEPELQRQFPIIALGSRWRNLRRGHVHFPVLHERSGDRDLDLDWGEDDPKSIWTYDYRFLAVSK